MKATKVYFERTKSLPGFHNRKVGIEITLEKGDKADDAMKKAELFVARELGEAVTSQQMEMALGIVEKGRLVEELRL